MDVVEEEEEEDQDREVADAGSLVDESEDHELDETEASIHIPEGAVEGFENMDGDGEDKEQATIEEELNEEERKVMMEEDSVTLVERVSWSSTNK